MLFPAFVEFTVTKTGNVENTNVLQGVSPEIDKEALRVVSLMSGLWEPGKDKGKSVNVKLTIPVKFALN